MLLLFKKNVPHLPLVSKWGLSQQTPPLGAPQVVSSNAKAPFS